MRKGTAILACCILPAGARQIDGTFWVVSFALISREHGATAHDEIERKIAHPSARQAHTWLALPHVPSAVCNDASGRACVARLRSTPVLIAHHTNRWI